MSSKQLPIAQADSTATPQISRSSPRILEGFPLNLQILTFPAFFAVSQSTGRLTAYHTIKQSLGHYNLCDEIQSDQKLERYLHNFGVEFLWLIFIENSSNFFPIYVFTRSHSTMHLVLPLFCDKDHRLLAQLFATAFSSIF
jgi:hypothetical protein